MNTTTTTAADNVINLRDGGVVVVLLGDGQEIDDDYRLHPSVYVVDTAPLGPHDVGKCFPSNAKAVITTRWIPKPLYDRLKSEFDRRRTIHLFRDGKAAVNDELRKILARSTPAPPPPPTTPAKTDAASKNGDGKDGKIAPRGSIKILVAEQDPTKSIAEESRRLFRLAQERGITTTYGSVAQAVSVYRRKHRLGDRPASIVAKTPQLRALQTLDESIDGLSGMIERLRGIRDFVEKSDRANDELQSKLALMREAVRAVDEI